MTPDKTLKFKGEKCSGGKMSKSRITVMVAANMTGSCKEKLLVIGKSKKPRCFKNIRSLPVSYRNNTKSWMTSEIFEKWLRNWDTLLKSKKRKILLLIDNCPAHPQVANLQCIKVVFLPPNVTAVLQPMDQGVIKSLKAQYRKLQVLHMLQNLQKGEHKGFNVLDAILMLSEAWGKVTKETVANCFRHAGFKDVSSLSLFENDVDITSARNFSTADDDEDNLPLAQLAQAIGPSSSKSDNVIPLARTSSTADDDYDDVDDIPLARLMQALDPSLSTNNIEEFIEIDNNLHVCAPVAEEEILAEIQGQSSTDESEDEQDQLTIPTLNEALCAITTLQKFLIFNEEFKGNAENHGALERIRHQMQNAYAHLKCKKQTVITDYIK